MYCKDKDGEKHPITKFELRKYTFKRVFIKYRNGGTRVTFIDLASEKSIKVFLDKG